MSLLSSMVLREIHGGACVTCTQCRKERVYFVRSNNWQPMPIVFWQNFPTKTSTVQWETNIEALCWKVISRRYFSYLFSLLFVITGEKYHLTSLCVDNATGCLLLILTFLDDQRMLHAKSRKQITKHYNIVFRHMPPSICFKHVTTPRLGYVTSGAENCWFRYQNTRNANNKILPSNLQDDFHVEIAI